MNKLFTILLALFCFSPLASAQSYLNLFSASHQNSPNNNYDTQEGTVDIEEWDVSFTLPIPRKNGDAFLVGGTWHQLKLTQELFENGTAGAQDISQNVNLTYIQGRFGYVKKWNDTWKGTFLVLPKIASDFEEISGKDWQLGVLALLNKQQKENLSWKFGLYYNHEFFAPFLVPLVGLDWKIRDSWRLFGVMPSTLTLEKKVAEKLRFGANISSPVVSYRLSDANPLPNAYVQQTYFTKFMLFSDVYLTKSLVLRPAIGHSVFRNYRQFTENERSNFSLWGITFGEREESQNAFYDDVNDGFIFEIGLQYRYDLEKK